MPTKPFDMAGFSKRLNPEQQKDFAALNRNTGGNFGNMGGEAGLMRRYGLNSTRPLPPMAPPVARPMTGNPPMSPPVARPIAPKPPMSGGPIARPIASPMGSASPAGPMNLPPAGMSIPPPNSVLMRQATPPGAPNLPPTQDDLIRQLVLRNFRY